jgi:uncharacterized glyoxalase superfamily protein PhnB
MRLEFDVAVSDVPAALRFYATLFGATVTSTESAPVQELALGRARLRLFDDVALAHRSPLDRDYKKGIVPRLDLQVQDVEAWVRRAIDAGAKHGALSSRDSTGRLRYAHIVDPFGHLWAFSLYEDGFPIPA